MSNPYRPDGHTRITNPDNPNRQLWATYYPDDTTDITISIGSLTELEHHQAPTTSLTKRQALALADWIRHFYQ